MKNKKLKVRKDNPLKKENIVKKMKTTKNNEGINIEKNIVKKDKNKVIKQKVRAVKSKNKVPIKQKVKTVKLKVKEMPFILDVDGGSTTAASALEGKPISYKTVRRREKPSDYYDQLLERERELATDLFGHDAEVLEDKPIGKRTVDSQSERKTSRVESDEFVDTYPFQEESTTSKMPAWVDEDDDNVRVKDVMGTMTKSRGKRGVRETSDQKYEEVVRAKFNQVIGGAPEWARLDRDPEDPDQEFGLTRTTGNYLSKDAPSKLPKNILEYKRELNLNDKSQAEGRIIKSVEFNPHFQVGLVAGYLNNSLGAATLFQVDGVENHKIQSLRFPSFPIKCARFLRDGKRFVVGSNLYGHFFMYDMEAGKETRIPWDKNSERQSMRNFIVSPDGELIVVLGRKGLLHLFDAPTMSYIDTLYSPQEVKAATFSANGAKMYTHGDGGDVLIWDMNSRVCVHKFYDDGCIDGTSIALSPNNNYLACGSSSGIVNIYDASNITSAAPSPVKVLKTLVTSVDALTFNASSELLAMASVCMENAFKLVHFPSMTYFANFPRPADNLRRIQVMNFSPEGGFLAAGNNFGRAVLYRLKHFSSY